MLEEGLGLAHVRLSSAVTTFAEMHDLVAMRSALTNWSYLAWAQGQLEQFVRVLGASTCYAQMRAADRNHHLCAPIMDARLEAARVSLGQAGFEAAWADGRTMTLEAAVNWLTQVSD